MVFSSDAIAGIVNAGQQIAEQTVQAIAAPGINNQAAWATLPSASVVQGVEAVLVEFDLNGNEEKPAWLFLVNPNRLQFRDGASYSAIAPHAAKVPYQHFANSTGATLTIPDLLLSTFCYGKSVRPLIEGIQALVEAKPEANVFAPPLLLFRMGSRRFGPCVLQDISWDESAWLGGEPARATLSITLLEVPKPLTEAEKQEEERIRQEALADQREEQGQPRVPLTERQREQASAIAREFLRQNLDEWDQSVQALVRTNRYSLSTDPGTGNVSMIGTDGKTIGVVLRADGTGTLSGFRSANITTVPIRTDLSAASPLKLETANRANVGVRPDEQTTGTTPTN